MRDGWDRAQLGDVADIKTGFPFKSAHYCSAPEGFRLLRGDNVVQRDIRWSGARYWPRSRIEDLNDYMLSPGDVVLAMDRPWIEAGLKVSTVRADDIPSLLVQRVARLRAVSSVSQEFLPWVLYTRDFTEYIKNVHTGTAVPHISPKQISDYWFFLPPLDEQRRIARVLGALDDLIETNEKLAASCAALVSALTVDALNRADLREPLSSVARFVNGKNFTKDAGDAGRPVIRTPEVRRGPTEATPVNDGEVSDENVATAGDILFVWSGSLVARRWVWHDGLVNQHVFKVIPNGVPAWLVFGMIEWQMPWFLSLASDKATTMGHSAEAP